MSVLRWLGDWARRAVLFVWCRIPGNNNAQRVIIVWACVVSIVVGYLFTDKLGENERTTRQQRQGLTAFCTKMLSDATAPVPSTASEFARNLTRGSVFAYQIAQCQLYVSPLRPGDIDPDVFSPAPLPPSPRPTR